MAAHRGYYGGAFYRGSNPTDRLRNLHGARKPRSLSRLDSFLNLSTLPISRVILRPEVVMRGGMFLAPKSAARMRIEAPGVERILQRHVFRRAAEAGDVLVGAELHRQAIQHRTDRPAVEVLAIARSPVLAELETQ